MEAEVSIIIVSYNTKALLRQCLDSITEAGITVPYEIIVVDNASVDGSAEMVAEEYPGITLVRNDENLMFAKGNNQGIVLAASKYILLLNSDTVIHRVMVDGLVAFMDSHPKAAAVGPKVVNPDGSLQSKGAPLPSVTQTALAICGVLQNNRLEKPTSKVLPGYCWREDDIRKVGWISGCCMMLRARVVKAIGGLLEELFFYREEVEWCYRAQKAGYEIWYYPAMSIVHLGGMSVTPDFRRQINQTDMALRDVRTFIEATVGVGAGLMMAMTILLLKSLKAGAFLCLRKKRRYASAQLEEAMAEIRVMKCLITRSP